MIEQNKYYFKELETKEAFKFDLEEIFSKADVYLDLGVEVYPIADGKKEKTTFPCIYIDISNSANASRYASSTEIQRYTDFTLTFDIYSKDLEKYTQDQAVAKIAEILINGIQRKYHSLILTLNQYLPNLDETVSRKQVRFEGTMDNKDNFIYSD